MMRWFTPACPVTNEEKDWIDDSAAWILNEFGLNSFNEVSVILPTPKFFPEVYSADEQDVRRLLDRVCLFMKVSPERIKLELCPDEAKQLLHHLPIVESSHSGAAGQYLKGVDSSTIRISAGYLLDPMSLVAIMAHELGHVLLLGDNRISTDRKDHEHLTDLLTVFLGLGIFTANSAFRFTQWSGGGGRGWETKRLGYLTESMFGYALALFAWLRGEGKRQWSKYLEGSTRHYFKSGLRYLEKTSDSKLTRDLTAASG